MPGSSGHQFVFGRTEDGLPAMGSPGGWALWSVCLCFSIWENAALKVKMRESSLEVVRGDSVVLPCSFYTSSRLSALNIIWTLARFSSPESPIQVIVYDHQQVIEDPSLTGRVAFTGLPLSADILLNDTRLSDAGIYRCMVNNLPETADPGIGELELSVLEPPSLPDCKWDGDTDMGGSVRLSCSVAEGVPTPDIHWEKVNPEEIPLPVNMEGNRHKRASVCQLKLKPKTKMSQDSSLICTTFLGDFSGSVQIVNVSSQTSGLYRCSATNILGTENCYVNLAIYSTPDHPSGLLQAVLLTLAMSLVLLALLVLILWLHHTGQDGRWKERKAEEDECYNEIRYTPSLMKRSFV